jgi:hypothetical protein
MIKKTPYNSYKIAYYKKFEEYLGLEKTIDFLKKGNFKSAKTKKLVNTNYFRARVNYEDRLIFTFIKYKDENYILLLELILGHKYEKSKFLKGLYFTESDINIKEEEIPQVSYMNKEREFIYTDKFLSFNPTQNSALDFTPPMLIIGTAGSGKTSITIEKLKTLRGKVLYTTLSSYLIDSNKEICYQYKNIDFLTFFEILNRVEKQKKREVKFEDFRVWAYRHKIKDIEKYFEEFNGILTGTHEYAYYSEESYLNLGIKQSLFTKGERKKVYSYFKKYQEWIDSNDFYDSNIVAYSLLDKIKQRYDFIVIDEIQDFTNMQIYFIFKMLKEQKNFIFAGDSNQILYANFFSWTNLKTMLLKESQSSRMLILKENYRNSIEITTIANQLLKIKQLRFGSIDKESNYLPLSSSSVEGRIHFFKENHLVIDELNLETMNSVEFAVIVLDYSMKQKIKSRFKTPLIFTIQEAKGLEYKNVILVNFVSEKAKEFNNIVSSISKREILGNDLSYARQKDKENREIERYKIYINSLYVAFTRGIENLYIIERKSHKIFELLGLIEEKKEKIKVEKSSKSAWEKEAKKLEKLNKFEQAKDIVSKKIVTQKEYPSKKKSKNVRYKPHIKIKKPTLSLEELESKVFNSNQATKGEKDKLFKLAKRENNLDIIKKLSSQYNFKSAILYLKNLNKPKIKKKRLLPNPFAIDGSDLNLVEIVKFSESYSLIKLALKNGADIDKSDSDGYTALMIASMRSLNAIARLLIDFGADREITNLGKTAMMMAEERKDKNMIKILG